MLARLGVVDFDNVRVVAGLAEPSFVAIGAAAKLVLDAGTVPVAIGGDSSVSLLLLMRAADKRYPDLVVLHVDAHTDAYAEDEGDVPFNSATQFTHAASERASTCAAPDIWAYAARSGVCSYARLNRPI